MLNIISFITPGSTLTCPTKCTTLIEGGIVEPQFWWDLMIGTKARIFLSKYVLLGISGDIGGFGIHLMILLM